MSATNKTPNLDLPQWVEGDEIEREDFNAAFANLDANFQAFRGAVLSRLTTMNVTTATTYIPWNNKLIDTDGFYNGSQNAFLTIPSNPGFEYVRLSAALCFAYASSGAIRVSIVSSAGDWTEQSARVSGLTGFAATVATQTPPIKVLGGEEFHVTSRHDILSGLELLSGLRVYFSLEVVG